MNVFRRMMCGAAAVLAAVLVTSSVVAAEAFDLTSFSILPPDGYEVSTTSTLPPGVYTYKEFLALSGQTKNPPVGVDTSKERVFVQVWDSPDKSRALSIVFEGQSNAEAAGFVTGALSTAGTESFQLDIDGQTGRVVHQSGVTEHVVVWHQGRYGVYVIGASKDAADSEAVARDLAQRQSLQLTSVLGDDAKVGGADDKNSTAYRLGSAVGVLALFGGIVAVVLYFTVWKPKRKQQILWTPSPHGYVPPGYPQGTGYPPAPGFPSTPGSPAAPGYPPVLGYPPAPSTSAVPTDLPAPPTATTDESLPPLE